MNLQKSGLHDLHYEYDMPLISRLGTILENRASTIASLVYFWNELRYEDEQPLQADGFR